MRVLTMIAGGIFVLLWLHPSLGYAPPGSIIAGADLRWGITQFWGVLFLTMGATASVVVALLPSATPRTLWYVVPYALGAVVAYRVLPIVDRYF
jgi:hypothetical protein